MHTLSRTAQLSSRRLRTSFLQWQSHLRCIGTQASPPVRLPGKRDTRWRHAPSPDPNGKDAPMPRHQKQHEQKKKRPPLTHFLSLPLGGVNTYEQLMESLTRFKQDVTTGEKGEKEENRDIELHEEDREIEEEMWGIVEEEVGNGDPDAPSRRPHIPNAAFRPPGCLHFTLGVMSLPSAEKLAAAKEHLRSLDLASILRNDVPPPPPNTKKRAHPLTISLRSLSPLPNVNGATSLYASPTPSEAIYAFASKVRREFIDKGLIVDYGRELLLHATVVNTIYAMDRKRGRGGQKGQKLKTIFGKERDEQEQRNWEEEEKVRKEKEAEKGSFKRVDLTDGGGGEAERMEREYQQSKQRGLEKKRQRVTIDARGLVQEFEGFLWAKNVKLDRLCICEMGAKKVYEDEVGGEVVKSDAKIQFQGRRERKEEERRVIDEVYREVEGVDIPAVRRE